MKNGRRNRGYKKEEYEVKKLRENAEREDLLSEIKNHFKESGMTDETFREVCLELEQKMRGMMPDIPVWLMRDSIVAWLGLMAQTKSEKVSFMQLSRKPYDMPIKCLFCDNYPSNVSGYIDKRNPRSVFYFACQDHYLGNPHITEKNRKVVDGIDSIYEEFMRMRSDKQSTRWYKIEDHNVILPNESDIITLSNSDITYDFKYEINRLGLLEPGIGIRVGRLERGEYAGCYIGCIRFDSEKQFDIISKEFSVAKYIGLRNPIDLRTKTLVFRDIEGSVMIIWISRSPIISIPVDFEKYLNR